MRWPGWIRSAAAWWRRGRRRAGLDPLAYLQRWADVRLVRWWARRPGGTARALAVGMMCGRLQGRPAPSPKLLAQNLAARERMLADLLGPEHPGELEHFLEARGA